MAVASQKRGKAGIVSVGMLALGLSVAVVPSGTVLGQEQQPPQQQPQQDGGGRGIDREQFRQRIAEQMKESLGASDEEWAVLQPKLDRVMTLQRQQMAGRGMGFMFRGRGDRGGDRGDRRDRDRGGDRGGDRGDRGGDRGRVGLFGGDDSPVAQRSRELQTSIEGNASSDELKAKLAALREARQKAREELAAAQNELRDLLTVKQEASLVMMGLLE